MIGFSELFVRGAISTETNIQKLFSATRNNTWDGEKLSPGY
jgi:hypothetical protein